MLIGVEDRFILSKDQTEILELGRLLIVREIWVVSDDGLVIFDSASDRTLVGPPELEVSMVEKRSALEPSLDDPEERFLRFETLNKFFVRGREAGRICGTGQEESGRRVVIPFCSR